MRARCCCWKAACSRRWRRTSTRPPRACSMRSASQLRARRKAGCCGAIRYHLNDQEGGLDDMRRNIDAWWPLVEAGVEAIVMTASGCGVTVKEYGHLLAHDPAYAAKAARISDADQGSRRNPAAAARRSCSAVVKRDDPATRRLPPALHAAARPANARQGRRRCSLRSASRSLPFGDSHLCCGSAGTYSVLQPELAYPAARPQARAPAGAAARGDRVGEHRLHHAPAVRHRHAGTHWIEWLDECLKRR